ncbi:hypothetical protein JTE90_024219 [Oedothorax gibbosus]|uniref:Uncharacterized protein n=1 Tax=Oedothorax gibbosus TaxID=931172 RepID=A0AAV6U8A8_9ARAC|nr:hypothetical protein JTE90_024219 [Oedothorax gibbosus]
MVIPGTPFPIQEQSVIPQQVPNTPRRSSWPLEGRCSSWLLTFLVRAPVTPHHRRPVAFVRPCHATDVLLGIFFLVRCLVLSFGKDVQVRCFDRR